MQVTSVFRFLQSTLPLLATLREYRAAWLGKDAIAVVPSGDLKVRNRDAEYPFRQDSDFHYLTGFGEPEAVAVLVPERAAADYILFVRERNPERTPAQQCGERPYHFGVHGLWPQFERGFPRDCTVPAPRLNRDIVSSMLDVMPSPRLVYNQWDRHGTCSGLGARGYFDAVRKAREATKIPPKYEQLNAPLMVTPDEVEDAFVAANPGMPRTSISVTCDSKRLSEVRICMTKQLEFRDCLEIERRACRRDKVVMPPVRGG